MELLEHSANMCTRSIDAEAHRGTMDGVVKLHSGRQHRLCRLESCLALKGPQKLGSLPTFQGLSKWKQHGGSTRQKSLVKIGHTNKVLELLACSWNRKLLQHSSVL